MKRIATLVLGAIGLSAVALGGIAVAGPGGPGGPSPVHHIMRVIHDLDLSEEQKLVLKEIRDEHRTERESMRAEREADMKLVKSELMSDTPDAALLHQLIDDRAATMQARMHDGLDTLLEVHAVLTPEQRAQIADELDDMRARHRERRERFESGERPRFGEAPR